MNSPATVLSLILIAFQGSSSRMPEDYWRNPRRCGINCLYGYMSIHGKEYELKDIARRVKLGVDGASLDDLQLAATDMGVPSSAVKITNTELAHVPLPAIAHFDVRGGHFQVLLEVNPDTVTTATCPLARSRSYRAMFSWKRGAVICSFPGGLLSGERSSCEVRGCP